MAKATNAERRIPRSKAKHDLECDLLKVWEKYDLSPIEIVQMLNEMLRSYISMVIKDNYK